ncbi:anthranilate synthase component II [Microscilla marina]|uniref:Anthranilate synthase component II n=1 Tax=Microscilla marina ATCC 23134 TaxID=313606 RepID=A1ZQ47_MICM2|nr:aminodeoxychorismate/anthranilate synthase component II [Microscilla marina]EAY27456.1 anthranilate synthase component II [Microscilla marina ATCC 23134]
MKKLLIADSYDSFTHNLIQLIDQHKHCAYTVVKTDQIDLDQVKKYDKILLTPGAGLPKESGDLLELIKHYAPTKSILGVCLGHQAIAEAFGACLYQLPQVLHGLTQTMQQMPASSPARLFTDLPTSIQIGLYHSWVVHPDSLPQGLEVTGVLASIDSTLSHFRACPMPNFPLIMAMQHRQYDVHGIQFHPESIMTPQGRTILYNWLDA